MTYLFNNKLLVLDQPANTHKLCIKSYDLSNQLQFQQEFISLSTINNPQLYIDTNGTVYIYYINGHNQIIIIKNYTDLTVVNPPHQIHKCQLTLHHNQYQLICSTNNSLMWGNNLELHVKIDNIIDFISDELHIYVTTNTKLHCIDLTTNKQLWTQPIKQPVKMITDPTHMLYVYSSKHITKYDQKTGHILWTVPNLQTNFVYIKDKLTVFSYIDSNYIQCTYIDLNGQILDILKCELPDQQINRIFPYGDNQCLVECNHKLTICEINCDELVANC